MASNRIIGQFVLIIALTIFLYFFFWVAIYPFLLVEEGNWIHSLFPPLIHGFVLPITFGTIFLGGISLFTLYHLWLYIQTHPIPVE